MEEGIKILEEFLDLARTRDYKGNLTGSFDEFELEVEEKEYKAIENLLTRYKQLEEENKKLKKYDIRNIKIGDDKILKSPSFTKEEIDLMNLGIALSTSFDVLFNDEREE